MLKTNGYPYKPCGRFWTDVWSEIRPYFIKLSVHFGIFSLTLVALFLAQIVFRATQDFSRIIFIDPKYLTMFLYISDLVSFIYFIYYLNKDFWCMLLKHMKRP